MKFKDKVEQVHKFHLPLKQHKRKVEGARTAKVFLLRCGANNRCIREKRGKVILRCFPEIRDKDRRVCMGRESTVAGVHAQGIRTLALHEENLTCIFNRKGSAKFRLIVCENVFPKQVGVTRNDSYSKTQPFSYKINNYFKMYAVHLNSPTNIKKVEKMLTIRF